jgi:hypothetical protein
MSDKERRPAPKPVPGDPKQAQANEKGKSDNATPGASPDPQSTSDLRGVEDAQKKLQKTLDHFNKKTADIRERTDKTRKK